MATFILASLGALAELIVILTWFEIKPRDIFSAATWTVRNVTVSGRGLFLIFALAVFSLGLSSYGLYEVYFTPRFPVLTQWGADASHCIEGLDTSQIADLADKYYIAAACGVTDSTVDMLNDKNISISDVFNIAGTQQQTVIKFSPNMLNAMKAQRIEGAVAFNFWDRLFIFPKTRDISNIRTLSDVATFGGKLY